jgi:two-component system, cell cycle response regulator
MKSEVNILLLGFAPFEKSTFESFFKLVGRRETLYKMVADAAHAQVLLINGDNASAVEWALASVKSPQKAMYIGAPDPSGMWPTAPRPIKLTTVLGLLDVLVMASKSPPEQVTGLAQPMIRQPPAPREEAVVMVKSPPAPAPLEPPKTISTPATIAPAYNKGTVRQGSGARVASNFGNSNFIGLDAVAPKLKTEQTFDDILVVDDSDVALKFMQNRLTRYGFRAELSSSGEAALARVSAQSYKFVFLDVMMEGLDGYQTCRAIKQRKYASGRPPVVVMLTSRGGSIDKIRGGLAGCDAYLTKPLNEAELLKILSKHDEQVERSFRDTNMGGSGVSSLRSKK